MRVSIHWVQRRIDGFDKNLIVGRFGLLEVFYNNGWRSNLFDDYTFHFDRFSSVEVLLIMTM
jgi:hypothetical protein